MRRWQNCFGFQQQGAGGGYEFSFSSIVGAAKHRSKMKHERRRKRAAVLCLTNGLTAGCNHLFNLSISPAIMGLKLIDVTNSTLTSIIL
jgi:hypothetical protein